jgi:hypothetical protein
MGLHKNKILKAYGHIGKTIVPEALLMIALPCFCLVYWIVSMRLVASASDQLDVQWRILEREVLTMYDMPNNILLIFL